MRNFGALRQRQALIGVVGLGYVGLPRAYLCGEGLSGVGPGYR